MKKRILFMILASMLPVLVNAHHSHASLNKDDQRTMTGVVTAYLWRSPHVYMKAKVLNSSGDIVEYTVEMANPMSMGRAGWNKDTVKIGERITWRGSHDRDPDRAYMGISWLDNKDGERSYISASAQKQYLQDSGQELPANLRGGGIAEPASGIGEGTWQRIAEDGGRFKNIYTPAPIGHWPLTALARQKVENFSESDNPFNRCIITGPPRAMLTLPKFQWFNDGNVITIDRDLWPEKRVIHLDPETLATQSSAFGHSVGWFENDELHVRSDHFTSEPWALFWGLDSSEQLTLRERYWLSEDGLRLNVEMTISDPVMLLEPVVLTHQWKKVPDTPLTHAECSEDNANFFITAGYN
jgi:hypothetical protein